AESLSTTLRIQLLVWYVAYNYGATNRTPWPRWNTNPPSDQPGRASVFAQVSTAIATLDSRGYSIEPETIEQEFGFKIERTGTPDPNPPLGSPPEEEEDEELAIARLNTRASLRQRALTADDEFALALADAGSAAGAESLAPFIDELLDIINKSDKPADLYRALAEYYAD